MHRKYYKILKVNCSKKIIESLNIALEKEGALSISIEDPYDGTTKEQPVLLDGNSSEQYWDNSLISALFDSQANIDEITNTLNNAFGDLKLQAEKLEDKDWVSENRKQIKSIKIGKKLMIVPSWEKPVSNKNINIFVDPGLAFGSGSHPTTTMCLEWLEKNIKGGEKVLDYGSGSGILSIAASKLGASQVCGVDIDNQALESSLSNALKNNVTLKVYKPKDLKGKNFDIIAANILSNPLIKLAKDFSGKIKPKGKVVLSGFYSDDIEKIRTEYNKYFSKTKVYKIVENWVCLEALK
ncbi:MAG: Ribosomal protein L11 methyltransferase [uncultured bacterium]|nr:MAG: Ribosomal protein L11 methyltransferase [uncultured bacterium]